MIPAGHFMLARSHLVPTNKKFLRRQIVHNYPEVCLCVSVLHFKNYHRPISQQIWYQFSLLETWCVDHLNKIYIIVLKVEMIISIFRDSNYITHVKTFPQLLSKTRFCGFLNIKLFIVGPLGGPRRLNSLEC